MRSISGAIVMLTGGVFCLGGTLPTWDGMFIYGMALQAVGIGLLISGIRQENKNRATDRAV